MLFALAFLLATTVLGAAVSFRSGALRGLAEKTGMGMAIALMLQMWLPFFFSKIVGIESGPAVALGVCVLAAALLLLRRPPTGWRVAASSFYNRDILLPVLFLTATSAFLGWMFYTHNLQPTPEGLSSAGVSWEDQSYHAMLASSFLYSDNLNALGYPHFQGWPLGYPFLPDLLAATLVRLGASLGQAFWWSAWYAGSAFILLAWALCRAWLGKNSQATLALLLFLCAGGLGFLDFIHEAKAGLLWPELLMRHDYVNGWELGLHYHNPVTGVLLPMRTSLFGMPVALAILLIFLRLGDRLPACLGQQASSLLNSGSQRRDWLLLGVLTGLLPLVHAHSFLVLGWCATAYLFLFLKPTNPIEMRSLLWAVIPMAAIALPQLLWTHAQMVISDPPFIRIHLGWMCDAKSADAWLQYWLHNSGLRLPLGCIAWGLAPVRLKKWTGPLLGLLILGNVVVFQPFVYDNIKLFIFADLALAALTAALLARLWEKSHRLLAALLVLLLTASGILSIGRETRLHSLIVDRNGMAFAELVKEYTAPRSVLLTGSEHTHPVPVLTGRSIVMGYVGWLGQHGVPFGPRAAEVKTMFAGGGNARELLRKYRVDYVVIGPPERREFPELNEPFIAAESRAKFEQGPYALYQIRK